MVTKDQATSAKTTLQALYPGVTFGFGKDGDDWTIEVRDSGGLTVKLPSIQDGVKVRFRSTGDITPQL